MAINKTQEQQILEFHKLVKQAVSEEELETVRDALLKTMVQRNGLFDADYSAACGRVIISISERLNFINSSLPL